MITKPVRRVKCRFCAYTVPAMYRTKSGAMRNWVTRMRQHIEQAHPEETEKEDRRLLAEEEDLTKATGRVL